MMLLLQTVSLPRFTLWQQAVFVICFHFFALHCYSGRQAGRYLLTYLHHTSESHIIGTNHCADRLHVRHTLSIQRKNEHLNLKFYNRRFFFFFFGETLSYLLITCAMKKKKQKQKQNCTSPLEDPKLGIAYILLLGLDTAHASTILQVHVLLRS